MSYSSITKKQNVTTIIEEDTPESIGASNKRDLSRSKFKEYNSYFDGIEDRSILIDDFVASSETLFHKAS